MRRRRGVVIDRFVIKPSNEAERNIIHLLPFLPIPVSPILPPCSYLPAIVLNLLPPLTPYMYPLCPFSRCVYAHSDRRPKTAIFGVTASLLFPVPCLCRCRRLHIPVSPYPTSLLSLISVAAIVHLPFIPLTLYEIPTLSRISVASVIILMRIRCGPHCIVFHILASFNAFVCLHVY